MSRLAILVVIFAAALAGARVQADTSGQQLAQSAGQTLIGSPAPALVLTTIDGERIDLGKLYGHKAVYLKFWATWCVPCRQQMPHFESTYEHAGPHLEVIAVNAGFNDSVEDVKAYRQSVGLRMPIVIDDGRLADALHLRVTPQHVVIGRDGRILYIGHLVDAPLEAALVAAQASPPQATPAHASAATPAVFALGAAIPVTHLRTLHGEDFPVPDPSAKQRTVLVFLSPWCESYLEKSRPERSVQCRQAREEVARRAPKSADRWLIVASGLWATQQDLESYAKENHLSVPMVLDESGELFRRFGVRSVPVFVRVDEHGHIDERVDGAQLEGSKLLSQR
jgi:thiol-disulfide isomerase/thioredoxin